MTATSKRKANVEDSSRKSAILNLKALKAMQEPPCSFGETMETLKPISDASLEMSLQMIDEEFIKRLPVEMQAEMRDMVNKRKQGEKT